MSLALRVFVPFALAYLLSYLLRVVNAVAGEPVTAEFGLSPADLGLMTSLYFMGFAVTQFPLGILMDRYGPRRVEAAAWIAGAVGCVVFATGMTTEQLFLGRLLIGIGASMALMGPMTAYRHWFSPERRALVVGLHMAFGGIGSALGGGPTELAIAAIGWRPVFGVLAVAAIGAALAILFVVPRRHEPRRPTETRVLVRELLVVLSSRTLWRIAPMSAAIQIGMLSVVSLWAGPWLRQVVDLPASEAAFWLSANSIGLIAGFLGYGVLFARAERLGLTMHLFIAGTVVVMLMPLAFIFMPPAATPPMWILYATIGSVAVHSYNIISAQFPVEMAGRVNTALNFVVFLVAFLAQWGFGLILDGWRDATGAPTAEGFAVAFIALIAVQLVSMLPLLLPKSAPTLLPASHST
ncbi:MFS transporter [Acuticoccus sp. I52.16.1]|uniref:MFS transporter n=1 Tax=Acuticoccus sp. I52.16.1 TaxID=2928472 RepID=UPI001FD1B9AA|nr:MFS transporter [Acuticoccus sp. I52.16.1]UOM34589.1 MFS transporter [Acuticoccus sp. I52.16.1]